MSGHAAGEGAGDQLRRRVEIRVPAVPAAGLPPARSPPAPPGQRLRPAIRAPPRGRPGRRTRPSADALPAQPPSIWEIADAHRVGTLLTEAHPPAPAAIGSALYGVYLPGTGLCYVGRTQEAGRRLRDLPIGESHPANPELRITARSDGWSFLLRCSIAVIFGKRKLCPGQQRAGAPPLPAPAASHDIRGRPGRFPFPPRRADPTTRVPGGRTAWPPAAGLATLLPAAANWPNSHNSSSGFCGTRTCPALVSRACWGSGPYRLNAVRSGITLRSLGGRPGCEPGLIPIDGSRRRRQS